MDRTTIGLIVNPVAGMGGSVGLKGTDGGMHHKAIELGAEPVAPARTSVMLKAIKEPERINFLAAPGAMGADHLTSLNISFRVVGSVEDETSASDTRMIAHQMFLQGAQLIIFVGGDGTARDIHDVIGLKIPVVAVPAGVKVFSAVFAVSPRAAAEMVDVYVDGCGTDEQEVLDIDEAAYRDNRLSSQLYGVLRTPDVKRHLQAGKSASDTGVSAAENKEDIAAWLAETLAQDTLYLLGPGTTIKALTDALSLVKTLLGVDAIYNQRLIDADLNEKAILGLLSQHDQCKIIVTPLGGNGFIFGRGNKQFTPQVIQKAGRSNITVIGNREKMQQLDCLRVDTGNDATNELLSGYIPVIVGYKESRMMRVCH
jgi:predicted polyphosphate/ATP-dependent NAD kinase